MTETAPDHAFAPFGSNNQAFEPNRSNDAGRPGRYSRTEPRGYQSEVTEE